MPETKTPQYTLTITLRDGTEHSFEVDAMPRHWKSWVMRQLPWGTDVHGAEFSRTSVSEEK